MWTRISELGRKGMRTPSLTTTVQYSDPATGRWLNEDPVGFDAGDENLFRYGCNYSTDLPTQLG